MIDHNLRRGDELCLIVCVGAPAGVPAPGPGSECGAACAVCGAAAHGGRVVLLDRSRTHTMGRRPGVGRHQTQVLRTRKTHTHSSAQTERERSSTFTSWDETSQKEGVLSGVWCVVCAVGARVLQDVPRAAAQERRERIQGTGTANTSPPPRPKTVLQWFIGAASHCLAPLVSLFSLRLFPSLSVCRATVVVLRVRWSLWPRRSWMPWPRC